MLTKEGLIHLAGQAQVPQSRAESEEWFASIDALDEPDRSEVRAAFTRAAFEGHPEAKELSDYDRRGLARTLRERAVVLAGRSAEDLAEDLESRRGGNYQALIIRTGAQDAAVYLGRAGTVLARSVGPGLFIPGPVIIDATGGNG
jgi:hypothetical protein